MKIVALTDIHGSTAQLAAIAPDLRDADLVLLTGDLTHFGKGDAASDVLDAVREYNRRVLAVPGNCDYPAVGAYLTREGVSLDRRHEVIEGVALVGVGGSLPAPGHTPNELSEAELRAALEAAAAGIEPGTPLILVAHQPPLDTVTDLARIGQHVGSSAVRDWIEQHQPLICFTGHIHEGRGMDTIGATRIINPGPLREGGYAYAEVSDKVEVLELRSG